VTEKTYDVRIAGNMTKIHTRYATNTSLQHHCCINLFCILQKYGTCSQQHFSNHCPTCV